MSQKSKNNYFSPWTLEYNDYDRQKEKSRESLLTVGNGYIGTRGAMEETTASESNYPGTYIAGLYNKLISKVADRDIKNEDFVNCPNWTFVNFKINDDPWFDINNSKIISIKRQLHFNTGILFKELVVENKVGKQTKITSNRIASMANPHLLAIQYKIQPLNYTGVIEIKSNIDGNIINDGVARYRDLNQQHLKPVTEDIKENTGTLVVETTQSGIKIVMAAKHLAYQNGNLQNSEFKCNTSPGFIQLGQNFELNQNEEITIEKIISVYTSKSDDSKNPLKDCSEEIVSVKNYNSVLSESKKAWGNIWKNIDIQISGDDKSQMLIRLHLHHLMVTASPHNVNIDAGIPARGLHGEAYRGHIFWDELYILPFYNIFFPDVAKSILTYRFRRIEKAREYAHEYGFKGAMFPWQSGSDGSEETQVVHLNPISGKWGDDYSSLQRHISIAIAYNIWYYFQVTNDNSFMESSGAEIFLEICRFWASKSELDKKTGRYNISKVMGPDEFHEKHKASKGGGIKNNAYTNIMVVWLFEQAFKIINKLSENSINSIKSKIKLDNDEINEWKNIVINLNIPVSEKGIIEQFEGYFELKELDWDAYQKEYDNIYRLDRILKAEGKSPDDYKLAKQADTLMTFYNIDKEDIRNLLKKSGHTVPDNYLAENYNYYINRTSHGSTLSRVVHAYLANLQGDKKLGSQLYFEALQSDYTDIQGGTTAEGIHSGVMGGTVLMAITSFAGVNLKKDMLSICPGLPKNWDTLKFNISFKNNNYFINLSHKQLRIEIKSNFSSQIKIEFSNKKIILQTNKIHVLDY